MDRPAPVMDPIPGLQDSRPLEHLTPQERAVYHALVAGAGRVVSRKELARAAGVADLGVRRCDSLIVGVRRAIGADRVLTVRRRGWMLVDEPDPNRTDAHRRSIRTGKGGADVV